MTETTMTVAIAGVAGRMGRQLVQAAGESGLRVTGGSEAPGSALIGQDIGHLIGAAALGALITDQPSAAMQGADLWVDFTTPDATLAALEAMQQTDVRAVIIGTTGFDAAAEAQIAVAAKTRAIVKSGNFSVGINLLSHLVALAAARLGEGWDIEILETHHRRKVDAPSGTALMLGEAAAAGRGGDLSAHRIAPYDGADARRPAGGIGFAVRRSGGVIGEHEVTFGSDQEVISLSHTALDRAVFAAGAIRAGLWALSQPPGLYDMNDVLGLTRTEESG